MIKNNILRYFTISVLILSASSMMVQNNTLASNPLDLGTAQPYVILSGGVITNGVTNQLVTGNTGHVSTLSANFTYVTGADFAGAGSLGTTATLGTPLGDQRAVLTHIGLVGTNGTHAVSTSGLACTFAFANGAINLATDITHGAINQYAPGVYCINGAASIGTAGINLNATGIYIFKINGELTTVSGSSVTFNGAPGGSNPNAGNVFWVPVSGASTFGSDQFSGTILSGSAAISTGATGNYTNARFISESAITIGGGANTFTVPSTTTLTTVDTTVDTSTTTANGGGSSNGEWATKPTFGVSYQTNKQFVTDGFGYSVFAKTITDNFHTGFLMADIPTDTSYPLYAKGYFANQLKIQEFCFGIPETGKGYLAESCIEVHFDSGYGSDRKITDVKIIQDSNVIDDVSVQHEMASCNTTDTVKVCDKTMITIAFAEPLQHSVMMIKGIDWKGKSTETYLNEGFNVNGKQLTDLPTTMIPSPTKYEGLIKVTQSEKYSDIWISDDRRVFERNSYGSFKQINQTYEKHQDTGDMKNRNHSAFAEWKDHQAIKAKSIWDASKYVSTPAPSFTHDYPVEDHRTTFLKEHNMLKFVRGQ